MFFALICIFTTVGYAQPADAVYISSESADGTAPSTAGLSTGSFSITGASNVVSRTGVAHLAVSSTVGVATAYLHMTFASEISTNPTVYIKVNEGASSLLGGGLTIQAYKNAGGTANPVSSTTVGTFYTADGNIYIAIKPSAAFQSIRLTLSSAAALGSRALDVYYAFYGPTATNDTNPFPFNVADCGLPNVTTTAQTGAVTLASFVAPGNAIDNSVSTATAYTMTVGLLGTLKQTFHFNGKSNAGDAVRIIFSKGSASGIANIDIASSLTIQAYNGSTPVGTATPFVDLLNLNLLSTTLLSSSSTSSVTAYLTPTDVYDRVVVSYDVTVAILGNLFNVFDVRRVPKAPTSANVTACTNVGTATLAASTLQSSIASIGSFTYKWYTVATGGTATIIQNLGLTGLTTVNSKDYYVDIQKAGCESSATGSPSSRTKVTVNTILPPVSPPLALVP